MKLLALLGFFAFCCTVGPKADSSKMPVHHYSFLSLGDSYTIGESVPAPDRWSVQLAGLLREDGLDIADPEIIARTGWTTDELQTAIQRAGEQKTYSLVSLLIGVNNQYRGQSLEKYRKELAELLQTATRFAAGRPDRVLVLSIPDWGQSAFAEGRDRQAIAREIDAFNAVAAEECRKARISFIDITPLTRAAAGDPTQFADDGLHYSGNQHRLWAQTARAVAAQKLRTP